MLRHSGCLAAALVVVLSTLAVPASAQAGSGQAFVVDDPTGDTSGPLPAQGAGFLDIVHVEVQPDQDGVEFLVQVASLQTDPAATFTWELWVALEYRGARFDAVIGAESTTAPLPPDTHTVIFGPMEARLYRMSPDRAQLAILAMGGDAGTRTFNATIPWDLLIEPNGNSPNPGESVRLLEAASAYSPIGVGTPHNAFPLDQAPYPHTSDVAPFPDGTFITVAGAIGDISLATPIATRYSNGEATTMHWPIEVANHGSRDLQVTFSFDVGKGAGIEGRAPPGLHLGPMQTKVVNVYVTLPFVHEHGTTKSFPFIAATDAGDRATLELGVDYPAIPQPAGHHPDLFIHASYIEISSGVSFAGYSWMNTLQEDLRSLSAHLMGGQETCPGGTTTPLGGSFDWGTFWLIGLDPGLRIGLDARLGETASLDVSLAGRAQLPAGTLFGRLFRESNLTADFGLFDAPADPFRTQTLVAAATTPAASMAHLDLPIPTELDLVPPGRQDDLLLALLFCPDLPEQAQFAAATANTFAGLWRVEPYYLLAGGHLAMPLDEYHDVVPVSPIAGGLAIDVVDPVVHAASGATVVWRPSLTFPSGDKDAYVVRLFGNGAPHATLLGPARLSAGETVEVPVSFLVPDAAPGTVIDLLLEATHESDPAKSVGLRLAVVVDPAAERDDAALAAELADSGPKDTPTSLASVILALAFVALRRRRQ